MLPPDPLHVNLLGCGNDTVECLEENFPVEMASFYKKHNLSKSREEPGGKFNGPSMKFILREETRPEVSEADPGNQKVTRSKVSNFSKEVTN